jgi:hypothetical protein
LSSQALTSTGLPWRAASRAACSPASIYVVVVTAIEHRADIVFQDLDLFAGDLRPARVVADHRDHGDAVASEGVELGE